MTYLDWLMGETLKMPERYAKDPLQIQVLCPDIIKKARNPLRSLEQVRFEVRRSAIYHGLDERWIAFVDGYIKELKENANTQG